MTPCYYKIQQIVDGITGEVISQQVLDMTTSPVEQDDIVLFSGDIVRLVFVTSDEYDLEFRKAQSLESWREEDSVSFPDPCEANE